MRGNSTLMLDAQRRLARGILVGLVTAVVLFVLFASGPNLGLTFAQQPSPTYKIAFLNPSGHSEEVSAKDDRTNTTYHLVAWVNELPADAGVVFAYSTSSGSEIEIGTGTQTGIADTFDFHWDIPASLPDGPLTLHAILYSGQTELARDTESDLTLNNKDPGLSDTETEARGETVEITYPAVGGAFGFYRPRDLGAAGVMDVTHSSAAAQVRAFFTATAPGNEPAWTQCGNETAANAANGLRCTLPLGRDPLTVTALGAMAIDAPAPATTNTDSGDAHRIGPYTQIPTNFSVDPAQSSVGGANTCSPVITSTLTDQNGIIIASANIDVHAAGPSDALAFNASGSQTPELAHGKEPAANCASSPPGSSGQQGEHEDTGGNDVKHVESTAGTDDDGKWTFQLYSPTAGGTQFTAWVDHDSDDVYCSEETNASGAIGFQQAAPGVSGVAAETTSCPAPSPTSPNPGPTTPGPSPSDSESPDPRGCTIEGTSGSEEIEGTDGDDVICAGAGDDIIRGLGGNDIIYGDDGRDDIRGSGGKDTIYGGAGKDVIRGNGGGDTLFGEDDNDVLTGGAGQDEARGGAGFDTIRGSGSNDSLFGQTGDDTITGGAGDDELSGGPGKDALVGGKGRDDCTGGGGRDSFQGCERQRR